MNQPIPRKCFEACIDSLGRAFLCLLPEDHEGCHCWTLSDVYPISPRPCETFPLGDRYQGGGNRSEMES